MRRTKPDTCRWKKGYSSGFAILQIGSRRKLKNGANTKTDLAMVDKKTFLSIDEYSYSGGPSDSQIRNGLRHGA